MREEWDNLTRVNAENSREYIESIYDSGARHGYNLIGKSVGVTLADRETLFHLKNYNYDLIKSLNKEAVQEIRKTLTQAEAEGLHPFETARLLRDSGLEATSGLSPLQRAKVIARTESRRASTAGSVQAYRNYGIEEWDLVTAGDSLVCEDCLDIEAANPHGIRETDLMPPIHPNCYSRDTKLYTKDCGWKFVEDVDLADEVLTINPETRVPEFQRPVNVFEEYADEVIHIHNNIFSMCVTDDHDCLIYQRREKNGEVYYDPQFRKPDEINTGSRFLRLARNDNVSPKTVDINGLTLDFRDYLFFMAWYISEGSVNHSEKGIKQNPNRVMITQTKSPEKDLIYERMTEILEPHGIKLHSAGNDIVFSCKELADHVRPLGYSYDKYLPQEVFKASKSYANYFLYNYILGDGSKHVNKNGYVERNIFTSSPCLRDDLSYLILLAGYCPSIRLHTEKGSVKYASDGREIRTNHDVWCIRLTMSEYAKAGYCKSDVLDYKDNVYCVEVPNHTLWIQHNGKCSWGGNCRCVVSPVVKDVNKVMDFDSEPVYENKISPGE